MLPPNSAQKRTAKQNIHVVQNNQFDPELVLTFTLSVSLSVRSLKGPIAKVGLGPTSLTQLADARTNFGWMTIPVQK